MAVIGNGFAIWPFDFKAAAIAAELQGSWSSLKATGQAAGLTRQTIKADIQIIATAIAAGATALYSEDGHMKSYAQGRIDVKCLPPVPAKTKGHFEQGLFEM